MEMSDCIALRPATADDVDFCFDLHKLSFHQYVTEVRGWDEDEQRAIHIGNFLPERVQIIAQRRGRRQVGRRLRRPGDFHLAY